MKDMNTENMSLEETMAVLATLKLSKKEQEEFLEILKEYNLEAEFGTEGNVLSVETL